MYMYPMIQVQVILSKTVSEDSRIEDVGIQENGNPKDSLGEYLSVNFLHKQF